MAAIKQALISVSDKTGILEFAKALNQQSVKILSTGGGRSRILRNINLDIADDDHRGIRVVAAGATRGSDESDRGVAP